MEDKLVVSETKVMQIDGKTQKMARQARLVYENYNEISHIFFLIKNLFYELHIACSRFVDQIANRSTLTSHAQKNLGKTN